MLVAARSKMLRPMDVGRFVYRACPGIGLFGTGGLR
jgi:hypothetical protein